MESNLCGSIGVVYYYSQVNDLECVRECRERKEEMTSWNYVMCPSRNHILLDCPHQEGWDGHIENLAEIRHCVT